MSMAGRKPKHNFNTLAVGEKATLTGRAKVYPHQYIFQYNKTGRRLKLIREGKELLVQRTK